MKQLELDLTIDDDLHFQALGYTIKKLSGPQGLIFTTGTKWQGSPSIEQRLEAIEQRLAIIDETQVPELGMLRDIYNKYRFVEALAKQKKERNE